MFVYAVAHMITAWEGLLKDAGKMQRQLMKNATVVFSFIEVRMSILIVIINVHMRQVYDITMCYCV